MEGRMGRRAFSTLFVIFAATLSPAQTSQAPGVGQRAPDFTLQFATKDSIARTPLTLSQQIGRNAIVLAFYPADWSGGCTKEMCTMRDDFGSLEKLHAEILAISGDYVFAHYHWAKEQNFPFRLLSDHLHVVAKQYDSYSEKYGFNKRTVFVIDKSGNIAYEDLEYSVADSDDFNRLKAALAKLE